MSHDGDNYFFVLSVRRDVLDPVSSSPNSIRFDSPQFDKFFLDERKSKFDDKSSNAHDKLHVILL